MNCSRVWGRSPRVRGRPRLVGRTARSPGSIPAGAGETCRQILERALFEVDPRGCGGDRCAPATRCGRRGRSPRVRGRHGRILANARPQGSIPAGAGETAGVNVLPGDHGVDPRGCGGDARVLFTAAFLLGRSPRVRGRHGLNVSGGDAGRSIPAGAGETGGLFAPLGAAEVDPRGCGGDAQSSTRNLQQTGRSPRVRGRPPVHYALSRCKGSIPAGAGETTNTATRPAVDAVDPRGCGGDLRPTRSTSMSKGRSPRVRGRPGC